MAQDRGIRPALPGLDTTARVITPVPGVSGTVDASDQEIHVQPVGQSLTCEVTSTGDFVSTAADLPLERTRSQSALAQWQPGATIDERYYLRQRLGSGAMGEVYLAHDRLLDKDVALKVLNPDIAQTRAFVHRFLREVALAHAVTHPNVVRIYDTGEAQGLPYFTMEYLRGQTLEEVLEANRIAETPMTLDEVVDILSDILDGLATAHRAGVIHRDLKPSNVMLTHRGAILLDFGVAGPEDHFYRREQVVNPPQNAPSLLRTEAGTIFGSPAYMAPELWEHAPATVQSDIYAVGVIAYQMLAGHLPFEGNTAALYVEAAQTKRPLPLRSSRKDLPWTLQRFVGQAMARSPDERFVSAQVARKRLLKLNRPRQTAVVLGTFAMLLASLGALWPYWQQGNANALGLADDMLAVEDLRAAVRAYDVGDLGAASFGLRRLADQHPHAAALAFWQATLAHEVSDWKLRSEACAQAQHWQGSTTWLELARAACRPSYEVAFDLASVMKGQPGTADRSLLPMAVSYDLVPRIEAIGVELPETKVLIENLKRLLDTQPDWRSAPFVLPTRWQLARVHLDLALGDLAAAKARLARLSEGSAPNPAAMQLSVQLDLLTDGPARAELSAQSQVHTEPRALTQVYLHTGQFTAASQLIERFAGHPTHTALVDMWCGYAFRFKMQRPPDQCLNLQPGLVRRLWANNQRDATVDQDLRMMRPVERHIWDLQQRVDRGEVVLKPALPLVFTQARPPFATYLRHLEIAASLSEEPSSAEMAAAQRLLAELQNVAPADPWTQLTRGNVAMVAGATAQMQRDRQLAVQIWVRADADLALIHQLRASLVEAPAPDASRLASDETTTAAKLGHTRRSPVEREDPPTIPLVPLIDAVQPAEGPPDQVPLGVRSPDPTDTTTEPAATSTGQAEAQVGPAPWVNPVLAPLAPLPPPNGRTVADF